MIYKSGITEKQTDCCGLCINFQSNGTTVAEINSAYAGTPYADKIVGECSIPEHKFDRSHMLEGVESMRWSSHTPCRDFAAYPD